MVEHLCASPILAYITPDFDLLRLDRPLSSHLSLSGQQNLFSNLYFEGRFRRDFGMGQVM